MITLSAEEHKRQHTRLATYRSNLAHLLQQAATYGGEGATPLDVSNAITAQRVAIAQLKATLRAAGAAVDDQADDGDTPPTLEAALTRASDTSAAAPPVQGSVTVSPGGAVYGTAAGVITGDVTGGTFTFGDKDSKETP
jgi:hypothetical protein